MQDRDFETLAGSIPFPASDIAADYSPVEKERIQGPVTRVLAALVAKTPLGSAIVKADQYGNLRVTKDKYQHVSIIAPRVDTPPFTSNMFQLPPCSFGVLFFVVTAITMTATGAVFGLHGFDYNGNIIKLWDTAALDTTSGGFIQVGDEIYQPQFLDNWKIVLNSASGLTSVSWYADFYYR